MPQHTNGWSPPVTFHFEVRFQLSGGEVALSFSEVDGLGQELEVDTLTQQGDMMLHIPKGVKYRDLTFKRALEPLSDPIDRWIKECFMFPFTGRIKPCNLLISLLDEEHNPVAVWSCFRAIPIKCDISTLKADTSGIAIETLILKHNYLERNK